MLARVPRTVARPTAVPRPADRDPAEDPPTVAQTKTASAKTTAAAKASRAKAAAKPAAKPKAPAQTTPPKAKAKPRARAAEPEEKGGAGEVTLDRRRAAERRLAEPTAAKGTQPAATNPEAAPVAAPLERREKVNRRRQIDPTTCERDYSDAEVEFMNALDAYKRRSGRMFPTCSEVLEVIHEIGYVRLSTAESAMLKASRGESAIEDAAEAEALDALAESDALRAE